MASSMFSEVGTASPPPVNSKTLMGVVPSYQVQLHVTGDETLDSSGNKIFPIIANLPERFNMEMTSTWDAPFARTSLGDLGSALTGGKVSADTLNAGFGASGIAKTNKWQTMQVWQESSPIRFNIELEFRAVTNSARDVRDKHKALLKLAAPSEIAGGVLRPPGPSVKSQMISSENSRLITMYIGQYLCLRNLVITSVASDVVALFDEQNIPQAMTISLGVESFFTCFTTSDIDNMFI